ncbi:MAG: reverse transcriptase/maturase family protein [Patescibacteria group bacterium]
MENLLGAWKEFRRGKRSKLDVLEFQSDLIYQVTKLHGELMSKTYKHGGYKHFKISDPKPRDIHKASVRDRLLHHAVYRILYPYFEAQFIHDSYSCRLGKGTHKAMNRFRSFAAKISCNHTRTCWVLKCDIRKFFASIEHAALLDILCSRISDQDILWLLREVIGSFCSKGSPCSKGLPLGNLTSQLLVNVYMNEFDQFVKHKLKVIYYIRYADDFVLLSHERHYLEQTLSYMEVFLQEKLKLELHSDKVFIKTVASGVDFLGWVHFANHRVLRTSTKRRMFRRLREREGSLGEEAARQSYFGMLGHGNARKLRTKI